MKPVWRTQQTAQKAISQILYRVVSRRYETVNPMQGLGDTLPLSIKWKLQRCQLDDGVFSNGYSKICHQRGPTQSKTTCWFYVLYEERVIASEREASCVSTT